MPNSAVARTPASQAAGSWRSTGRAEEKTIWEVLFLRSRLPISDQMASGHSQAMGSRYSFVVRERAGEDGDVQPDGDGPPPPAAAVEQQAQLGKQHTQEGVRLGQSWRRAAKGWAARCGRPFSAARPARLLSLPRAFARVRRRPSREGSKRANHSAESRISPRPMTAHNHCQATMPGVQSSPGQWKTFNL